MLGLGVVLTVGCSGGGGSPTPRSSAVASPTVAPTGATASPTATPVPGPVTSTAAVKPLVSGARFTYAGSSTTTFVNMESSPSPSATQVAAVTQSVAVSGSSTFGGTSGLFDYATAETDAQPLQTIGLTTNAYYGQAAAGSSTDLLAYGYALTDTTGQSITVTNAADNRLVDVLPETAGASWTNTGAQTIAQTDAGNVASTRTYAANGTYTDTTTYPSASLFTPAPGATATALTATIVENADGSGAYNVPLLGGGVPNATISIGAPAGGRIAISVVVPSEPDSRVTPTPAPIVSETSAPAVWYPLPVALYGETDVDHGVTPLPAACGVNASFGTSGNAVEQKTTRTDTVLGTLETLDQTTYVSPGYGALCVVLSDVVQAFYDYTGQGTADIGVTFGPGTAPLQTTTATTTLGLTGAGTAAPSAGVTASAVGLAAVRASGATALATARSGFLARAEHARLERQRRELIYLRTAVSQRMHR